MNKIGRCKDKYGNISDLYTDGTRYYRLNPRRKKFEKRELTNTEMKEARKKFGGKLRCSFAYADDEGYFCYTHRCRSKFYESPDKIPKRVYKFICSTG